MTQNHNVLEQEQTELKGQDNNKHDELMELISRLSAIVDSLCTTNPQPSSSSTSNSQPSSPSTTNS
jgi:hypothetical protein